jgi:ferric-dicitrate binding protein FerR (iron transport regulator)
VVNILFYVLLEKKIMHPLLNKYFAGTITDVEKSILFRESDNNAGLKEEFARLQNIMAISAMIHKENDEQWAAQKMNELMHTSFRRTVRRISLAALKYAAVAISVSCVWMFASLNPTEKTGSNGYTSIEVPQGQTIHVTLADGTETWLSSRTKLNIPARFNEQERTVELDGEALFRVSENIDKPFTVKTRQYNIRVTGTLFNVFAYAESPLFKTDLMEGSVFVYNKDDVRKAVCLNPEETVFLKDGQLVKTHSAFSYSRYMMNGIYYFENTPFKDMIDCLELWYNVKIHLRNTETGACVFSGKFRQSDKIELILQAIKETGKFNYKRINEREFEIY